MVVQGFETMDTEIDGVFRDFRTVAVVGLSKDPGKDSHRVAKFLMDRGFNVIPVNPTADSVLERKAFPSLGSLPDELKSQLEIVNIFRPSSDVPSIVDEALTIRQRFGRPFVIWMQLGIRNDSAAAKAASAGMTVIQDRCMMVEGSSREQLLGFRT